MIFGILILLFNHAGVVQWLERFLAKEKVAGSNPVTRSNGAVGLIRPAPHPSKASGAGQAAPESRGGGIGRHEGLKIPWR